MVLLLAFILSLASGSSAVLAVHTSSAELQPEWSAAGQTMYYTVTITNDGPDTIDEVRIYKNENYEDFVCDAKTGWELYYISVLEACFYVQNPDTIPSGENEVFTFSAKTSVDPADTCELEWQFETRDENEQWQFIYDYTSIDSNVPVIEKDVIGPQWGPCPPGDGEECWVRLNTEISVQVTDDYPDTDCDSGIDYCTYKIYLDDDPTPIFEHTFDPEDPEMNMGWEVFFEEDSKHTLEIVCEDIAGNSVTDVETFRVDDTDPITTKDFIGPKKIDGLVEWIDGITKVELTSVDPEFPGQEGYGCNIGVDKVWYRNDLVEDLDIGDLNPDEVCYHPEDYCDAGFFGSNSPYDSCGGEECINGCQDDCGLDFTPYTTEWYDCVELCSYQVCLVEPEWKLYRGEPVPKDEESCHVLRFFGIDHLGNEEDMNFNCFFVDKTIPELEKENGDPKVPLYGERDPEEYTKTYDLVTTTEDYPTGTVTISWDGGDMVEWDIEIDHNPDYSHTEFQIVISPSKNGEPDYNFGWITEESTTDPKMKLCDGGPHPTYGCWAGASVVDLPDDFVVVGDTGDESFHVEVPIEDLNNGQFYWSVNVGAVDPTSGSSSTKFSIYPEDWEKWHAKGVYEGGVILDWWVNYDTDIIFTCEDQEPHPSEDERVCFKISFDENDWLTEEYCTDYYPEGEILDMDPGCGESCKYCCVPVDGENEFILNFYEESFHDLHYFCEDAVWKGRPGHGIDEPHLQYYRVDNTPPRIEKYMFGSYLGDCPEGSYIDHGDCYVADDLSSGVEIFVYDEQDPCISGLDEESCWYELWWEGQIIDEGYFEDYKEITFDRDSTHTLKIWCEDVLGNSMYHEEEFLVDSEPPETWKEYGEPQKVEPMCLADQEFYCSPNWELEEFDSFEDCVAYYTHMYCTWWITSDTPVTLDSWDEKVGQVYDDTIYWRNLYFPENDEICYHEYILPPPGGENGVGIQACSPEWYSQFVDGYNDENPAWTVYDGEFFKEPESCHVIEYYAVDALGNEEIMDWQCVFVDNTAPKWIKEVGEPKIPCEPPEPEEGCVGEPEDGACNVYGEDQCLAIPGCDWVGDEYEFCDGFPEPDACVVYDENQCMIIPGCEWCPVDGCLGMPSISCMEIQIVGEGNGYPDKCTETPGCYWDMEYMAWCEGTPESCEAVAENWPQDPEGKCEETLGCEWVIEPVGETPPREGGDVFDGPITDPVGDSPCVGATQTEQCAYVASDSLPPYAHDTLIAQGVDPALLTAGCGDILILSSGEPLDGDLSISTDMGNAGCGENNPDGQPTYDCVDLTFTPTGDSVVLAVSSEWPEYYESITDWMRIGGIVDISINDWEPDVNPDDGWPDTPYQNVVDIPYSPSISGTITLATIGQGQILELRVADSMDSIFDTAMIVVPLSCFEDEPEPLLCGNGIVEPGEECEFDEDCNEGEICETCLCVEEDEPPVEECWWVRDDTFIEGTPITIDCEDQGPHPVEQEWTCFRVSYDIEPWLTEEYCTEAADAGRDVVMPETDDDWCCVYVGEDAYTFAFHEDSLHDFELYCEDHLGNTGETDFEWFRVDSIPPVTTKTYIPDAYVDGNGWDYIDAQHTVELTAEDGGEICHVDGVTTYYRYGLVEDEMCQGNCVCEYPPGEETFEFTGGVEGTITKTDNDDSFTWSIDITSDSPSSHKWAVGMPFATSTDQPAFQVWYREYEEPYGWYYQEYTGTGWHGWGGDIIPLDDVDGIVATGDHTGQTFTITVDKSFLGGPCKTFYWAVQGRTNLIGKYPETWVPWAGGPEEVSGMESDLTGGYGNWETYSEPFGIPDESCHLIEFWSEDALGNPEEPKYQCVFVDHTPPETDKWYEGPQYPDPAGEYDYPHWLTSETEVWLSVEDPEPHPSGVAVTYYRDIYLEDEEDWHYCQDDCYNHVPIPPPDPMNPGGAWAEWTGEPFYKEPESCHIIEYYSIDNVGKVEDIKWQCVFVDDSAPEPNKTVGEPKSEWNGSDAYYYDIADRCWIDPEDPEFLECWKVTLLTPISLECTDLDQPHPVPIKEVCFNIDLDGSQTYAHDYDEPHGASEGDDVTEHYCGKMGGSYIYDPDYEMNFCCVVETDFYFLEETEHELEYYCEDILGNKGEELDIEKFKVTGTTFDIELNKKWNLISVPFVMIDDSMEEAFEGLEEDVNAVWTFDAFTDTWYVYTPGPAPDTLDEMKPGRGYWVHTNNEATLQIGGSLFAPGQTPPDLAIKHGWNLIGYYGNEDHWGNEIMEYDGPDRDGEYAYCALFSLGEDYMDKGWSALLTYWEPWNPDQWDEYTYYDQLDPGAGYWLFATEDGIYAYTTVCGLGDLIPV